MHHANHHHPSNPTTNDSQNDSHDTSSYKPLIVIVMFCLLIPLFQIHPFVLRTYTYFFMGYFFIFLSLFKFFDLEGFAHGFSTYDLIAKQFKGYGYIYPFIEFLLGVAYLSLWNPVVVNALTLVVMLVSGAGVLKSIVSGKQLKCACLGTILNVPLSTVSVWENFGMALMALLHLLF